MQFEITLLQLITYTNTPFVLLSLSLSLYSIFFFSLLPLSFMHTGRRISPVCSCVLQSVIEILVIAAMA